MTFSEPPPCRIEPCRDVDRFFRGVVDEVREARHVSATDAAASYVVALLVDFTDPKRYEEAAFERPLTLMLHEALGEGGVESFVKLRQLGDVVLYLSGFFGEHFERRGVSREYVANLGSQAYWGARRVITGYSGTPPEGTDVFLELAGNFASFVALLEGVAWDLPGSRRGRHTDLLELYERWLASGSRALGSELASAGILPQRGDETMH